MNPLGREKKKGRYGIEEKEKVREYLSFKINIHRFGHEAPYIIT